ncbi:ATP-dependent DNA helicase [Elysia marginata]|uniref:ATP-dependent DNA helicase n=1 Tax=Elysia marginata TaxID=1093978 RepID=A0AAV4H7B9_9GAST|nr:ATP-dependent DNA helicase [Elysia marginata]
MNRKKRTDSIKVGLINARSVCNKAALIFDYLTENDFDIFLITETWVQNNDEPILAQVVPEGYDYLVQCLHGNSGGDIMVVFKDNFNMKKAEAIQCKSFELIEVTTTISNQLMRFLTIYRPPPSKKNKLIFTIR